MAGDDGLPARARKTRRLTKSVAQLIVGARAYFDTGSRRERRDDVTQPLKRTATCLQVSETLVKKPAGSSAKKRTCRATLRRKRERGSAACQKRSSRAFELAFSPCTLKRSAPRWTLCSQSSRRGSAPDHLPGYGAALLSTACLLRAWHSATASAPPATSPSTRSAPLPCSAFSTSSEFGATAQKDARSITGMRRGSPRTRSRRTSGWTKAAMGGMKVPSGKGMRSIVTHVGGESGSVSGAALIFRDKKALADSDYHTEMNSAVFLDWLEKKVFLSFPPRSVLVVDRATYHITLTKESQPAKAVSSKVELVEWLFAKGVQYEMDGAKLSTRDAFTALKRVELIDICVQHKPVPVFQAQELARKFDCDILLLPVAHPELNPIGLIWADIKRYVAKKNVTFKLSEVERLAHERIAAIGQDQWTKCVKHCIEVEDNYYASADEIPFDE